MSQKITAKAGLVLSFDEAVLGALDGKEGLLVSLDTTGKLVLFDGSIPAIGVMEGRLQDSQGPVAVRMLNSGGTARIIQNAGINPGVRVAGVNANGRVAAAATTNRAVGTKVSNVVGAAGDIIEVAVGIEYVP